MNHDLNRLLELAGLGVINLKPCDKGRLREYLSLVEVGQVPNVFVPQGPGGVPNASTDSSIVAAPENSDTDEAITGSWGVPIGPSDLNQSKTAPSINQDT